MLKSDRDDIREDLEENLLYRAVFVNRNNLRALLDKLDALEAENIELKKEVSKLEEKAWKYDELNMISP